MSKIIIYLRGGNIQDVISDHESNEVMIVDYDNEEDSKSVKRSFEQVRCDSSYFERTVAGVD